jgi:hypothetical protein
LIGIDHDESDLSLTGPDNDIATTADDDRVPVFDGFRDEGDVILEIDIQEESNRYKEASLQRLRAGSRDAANIAGPSSDGARGFRSDDRRVDARPPYSR